MNVFICTLGAPDRRPKLVSGNGWSFTITSAHTQPMAGDRLPWSIGRRDVGVELVVGAHGIFGRHSREHMNRQLRIVKGQTHHFDDIAAQIDGVLDKSDPRRDTGFCFFLQALQRMEIDNIVRNCCFRRPRNFSTRSCAR